MTPTDAQQQQVLSTCAKPRTRRFRSPRCRPPGSHSPAAVVSELGLNGSVIQRIYEHGRLVGVRLLEPEPPVTSSTPRWRRSHRCQLQYISRSPRIARLGLAFPRRRLPLPFRARFGSEGSARGRVDALMAIIPADAIPRRRVAAQHFLNDTGAGSPARDSDSATTRSPT